MSLSSRSSTHLDPSIPRELPGGFKIVQEIGHGSFAIVYEGFNTKSNQKVAIKAVKKHNLTHKLSQNLQDEINILKKIRHHNVVGLVDCISNAEHIFLIMQYCAQGDLSIYIKNQSRQSKKSNNSNRHHLNHLNVNLNHPISQKSNSKLNSINLMPSPTCSIKPSSSDNLSSSQPHSSNNLLPPSDRFPHPIDGGLNEWIVRSFLGQLADALHFLRSHSIIHRDIKPQNLLLHPSSTSDSPQPSPNQLNDHIDQPSFLRYVPEGIPILRVADFGFARVLTPNAGMAETLCGSPLYMAPEILRYEKYDAKADLWSVGAVLYEMAVGKPPFRAQNHVELLGKIEKSQDKITFPDDKMVSEDIKQLIRCLLKRNPIERVSFEEFFQMADQVSRVGPLNPPNPHHLKIPSSSTQPITLQPQVTTFHASPNQISSPRPPSTSTLPNPTPTKSKSSHRQITINSFDNEPGAFVIDKPQTDSHQLINELPRPSRLSSPSPSLNTPSSKVNTNQTTGLPSQLNPSHQAPSPSLLPTPLPSSQRASNLVPNFPAKYVVLGSNDRKPNLSNVVSTTVKSKDYALVSSSSNSKNLNSNFSTLKIDNDDDDDDRDLGTEYVVVEKGSVEINALVDALSSSPQKPLSLGRRMSRGFMSARPTLSALSSSPQPRSLMSASPPISTLVTTNYNPLYQHTNPVSSFPPRPPSLPSPTLTGTHPVNITNYGRSSPSNQAYHPYYPSSPRSFDSSGGGGGGGFGSLPLVGKYFPQSYHHNHAGPSPASTGGASTSSPSGGPNFHSIKTQFSFPSSQLCKAILSSDPNYKSNDLSGLKSTGFGSSNQLVHLPQQRSPTPKTHYLDSVESQLLNELEEFACKVLVILQFADEKMSKLFPPTPSSQGVTQTLIRSGTGGITSETFGAFVASPKINLTPNSSPTIENSITNFPPARQNSQPTHDSNSGSLISQNQKAIFASEAMVLYIKALAFLDEAIRHGVAVLNWKKQSSDGGGYFGHEVGYAIEWLRSIFNEALEKAQAVRSRVSEKLLANGMSAEKLIFDRALEKSRSAAVNELIGEKLAECEIEYESSLWMLYGLLDLSMKTEEIWKVSKPDSSKSRNQIEKAEIKKKIKGEDQAQPKDEEEIHKEEVSSEIEDDKEAESESLKNSNDIDIRNWNDNDNYKKLKESCEKIISSISLRLEALRKKIDNTR
ncbi:hypothetical protein O181_066916 [Austropuccinia psidii MF-1]|uniref:non-specific serine/threonine protein kinase n=1 Tax=Austropuccinia psidii MF-1 TaxID=1389203 RepID=A0A9Q3I2L4_9BASI|nr:hypothetical protein [Austropuccinia psidii MF-1]